MKIEKRLKDLEMSSQHHMSWMEEHCCARMLPGLRSQSPARLTSEKHLLVLASNYIPKQ